MCICGAQKPWKLQCSVLLQWNHVRTGVQFFRPWNRIPLQWWLNVGWHAYVGYLDVSKQIGPPKLKVLKTQSPKIAFVGPTEKTSLTPNAESRGSYFRKPATQVHHWAKCLWKTGACTPCSNLRDDTNHFPASHTGLKQLPTMLLASQGSSWVTARPCSAYWCFTCVSSATCLLYHVWK